MPARSGIMPAVDRRAGGRCPGISAAAPAPRSRSRRPAPARAPTGSGAPSGCGCGQTRSIPCTMFGGAAGRRYRTMPTRLVGRRRVRSSVAECTVPPLNEPLTRPMKRGHEASPVLAVAIPRSGLGPMEAHASSDDPRRGRALCRSGADPGDLDRARGRGARVRRHVAFGPHAAEALGVEFHEVGHSRDAARGRLVIER